MKILGPKEVKDMTNLSPVTIWRLEKAGKFPNRVNITEARVGWVESEIESWLEARPRGICQREIGGGKTCV
ncbi:AlpA family phage regulatory protein [candidate division KSB1 bacterium]|nr:AlpA family phage regulatory protein [candidate division KSB1 bacterium]